MRLIRVAQAARQYGIAESVLHKAIDSGLVKSVALVGNCGEIRTTKQWVGVWKQREGGRQ
jgi:hypothetical protein